MKVMAILSFMLGAVMFGGFLVQMWELFVQFRSGMKAIAITNEERDKLEFPSFALCHSRAFTRFTYTMVDVANYNSTTFNMEGQIRLSMYGMDDSAVDWGKYKAVPDTEKMSRRHRDRYSVLYLRHMLKSRLNHCIFHTSPEADPGLI